MTSSQFDTRCITRNHRRVQRQAGFKAANRAVISHLHGTKRRIAGKRQGGGRKDQCNIIALGERRRDLRLSLLY